MNRIEAVRYFAQMFSGLGLEEHEAETEAKLALSGILGIEIGALYLCGQMPVTEAEEYRMREILRRRGTGEPLAYILREQWFMGLRFRVSPAVLIPRRDTEVLCETAIQAVRLEMKGKVLDMCTGSGCVAVSIAKYTRALVTGADISEEALEIAALNARLNMLKVEFLLSDLFDSISLSYDVIVSNPPYIPEGEISGLMREVRDHEPRLALEAGRDGLKFYRRIAKEAPAHLNKDGILILEIGCEQAEDVKSILSQAGFSDLRVIKDYAQLDRVIAARL